MMSMALWKKMLLKSDKFQFSPGEFYFRACALRICDNAKDCTSRSVRLFFLSSILKCCFLWQSYRCEFGHHKENFVCMSTCQSEVQFLMLIVMCCEVPSTQTQDNKEIALILLVSEDTWWTFGRGIAAKGLFCGWCFLPRYCYFSFVLIVLNVTVSLICEICDRNTCSESCTWHFASKFSLACARLRVNS